MQLNLFSEKVTLESQKSRDHTGGMFTLRCQFALPAVPTAQLAFKLLRTGKTLQLIPAINTPPPPPTRTHTVQQRKTSANLEKATQNCQHVKFS